MLNFNICFECYIRISLPKRVVELGQLGWIRPKHVLPLVHHILDQWSISWWWAMQFYLEIKQCQCGPYFFFLGRITSLSKNGNNAITWKYSSLLSHKLPSNGVRFAMNHAFSDKTSGSCYIWEEVELISIKYLPPDIPNNPFFSCQVVCGVELNHTLACLSF